MYGRGELKQEALRIVLERNGETITCKELADTVNTSTESIRGALESLVRRGLVVRVGEGKPGRPFQYTASAEALEYSPEDAARLMALYRSRAAYVAAATRAARGRGLCEQDDLSPASGGLPVATRNLEAAPLPAPQEEVEEPKPVLQNKELKSIASEEPTSSPAAGTKRSHDTTPAKGNTSSGNDDKLIDCRYPGCGRAFPDRWKLQRHENTHGWVKWEGRQTPVGVGLGVKKPMSTTREEALQQRKRARRANQNATQNSYAPQSGPAVGISACEAGMRMLAGEMEQRRVGFGGWESTGVDDATAATPAAAAAAHGWAPANVPLFPPSAYAPAPFVNLQAPPFQYSGLHPWMAAYYAAQGAAGVPLSAPMQPLAMPPQQLPQPPHHPHHSLH